MPGECAVRFGVETEGETVVIQDEKQSGIPPGKISGGLHLLASREEEKE